MSYPESFSYTKDHEWVNFEDSSEAIIGITDYALEQLGDVVFLELPEVGSEFAAGDSFGTVESTKTVSDLYMPITGKVTAINSKIADNLEKLADDPYDAGWLIKISFNEKDGELLSSNEYEEFIKTQE